MQSLGLSFATQQSLKPTWAHETDPSITKRRQGREGKKILNWFEWRADSLFPLLMKQKQQNCLQLCKHRYQQIRCSHQLLWAITINCAFKHVILGVSILGRSQAASYNSSSPMCLPKRNENMSTKTLVEEECAQWMLFIIAPNWKQPRCPSVGEQTNKCLHSAIRLSCKKKCIKGLENMSVAECGGTCL